MTGLALTETAIKAAKPKGKPYMLRDDRGLWLLIVPGGGKYWRLRYWVGGKEKKGPWGPTLPSPLREARERLDKQIRGVCTEKYARNVLSRWERFVFPVLGGRDIREITAPELLRILRDVEEKVRAAYNHAEYPAERREMMQAWGEYFEGLGQSIEKTPQVRRFI